jgi:hypothetical protein
MLTVFLPCISLANCMISTRKQQLNRQFAQNQWAWISLALFSWLGFAAMVAMFYLAMTKPAHSADRPARKATIDLSRADWQPVPNGKKAAVFWVDAKGFKQKKGETVVTYDLIDDEAGYSRMETDCGKSRSRAIRQGYMTATPGKAEYVAFPNAEWLSNQNDPLKTNLEKFVCTLNRSRSTTTQASP